MVNKIEELNGYFKYQEKLNKLIKIKNNFMQVETERKKIYTSYQNYLKNNPYKIPLKTLTDKSKILKKELMKEIPNRFI